MSYPINILPSPTFKKIEHDLNQKYLIRHLDSTDLELIWNFEEQTIKTDILFDRSKHAVDLSASLLGIFKSEDVKIKIQPESFYNDYWDLVSEITPPVFPNEYTVVPRLFVTFKIGDLNGYPVDFSISDQPVSARCVIEHTPMNWNYWHMSIRWFNDELGYMHMIPNVQNKNWLRRFAFAVKTLMLEHVLVGEPLKCSIENEFFEKSKESSSRN